MSDFKIEQGEDGLVLISGEIVFANVSQALKASRNALKGDRRVTVDLSGVRRADSSGVSLLVEWKRTFARQGGSISFINLPRQMERIIRLVDVEEMISAS